MIDPVTNRIAKFDDAARRERLRSPAIIQMSGGSRGSSDVTMGGALLKIYEVLGIFADAVYLCYETMVVSDNWYSSTAIDKLTVIPRFVEWVTNTDYIAGAIVLHSSHYYLVKENHKSGTFDDDLEDGLLEFIYPWCVATSAWTDTGYNIHSKVTHSSKHYYCIQTHFVGIEPGVDTGWQSYWHEMWLLDDYVWINYNSNIYFFKCIYAHVSNSAYRPPNLGFTGYSYWEGLHHGNVLNLNESNPISEYYPALALYDRLAIWSVTDDEGNTRYVGIPVGCGGVRLAQAAEAPGSGDYMKCNLILRTGAEAASGELGFEIRVYFKISGGTSINAALPFVADNQIFPVVNVQGKWYAAQLFENWLTCP